MIQCNISTVLQSDKTVIYLIQVGSLKLSPRWEELKVSKEAFLKIPAVPIGKDVKHGFLLNRKLADYEQRCPSMSLREDCLPQ